MKSSASYEGMAQGQPISQVVATLQRLDSGCTFIQAIPVAVGSFAIHANANCAANTNVTWELH